jgi:hypothetical protein
MTLSFPNSSPRVVGGGGAAPRFSVRACRSRSFLPLLGLFEYSDELRGQHT